MRMFGLKRGFLAGAILAWSNDTAPNLAAVPQTTANDDEPHGRARTGGGGHKNIGMAKCPAN
jgi:hypothetical protein